MFINIICTMTCDNKMTSEKEKKCELCFSLLIKVLQTGFHALQFCTNVASCTVKACERDTLGLSKFYLFFPLYLSISLWVFCCLFQPDFTILHTNNAIFTLQVVDVDIPFYQNRDFSSLLTKFLL